MKNKFTFNFSSFELSQGDKKVTLGEGTSLTVETEYSPEEVIENIKSLPQIISTLKEAVCEVTKAISEFQKGETENSCNMETNRVDNSIRECDAEIKRATFHHTES